MKFQAAAGDAFVCAATLVAVLLGRFFFMCASCTVSTSAADVTGRSELATVDAIKPCRGSHTLALRTIDEGHGALHVKVKVSRCYTRLEKGLDQAKQCIEKWELPHPM